MLEIVLLRWWLGNIRSAQILLKFHKLKPVTPYLLHVSHRLSDDNFLFIGKVICRHLIEEYWQYSCFCRAEIVGVYFINLVLLLDIQLLTVAQGTVQILVADLSTESFFKTIMKSLIGKAFAFPKVIQCQRQLPALKIKTTFANGLWSS